MRILIITKRQYMNRDLIDDRYGRFRELPLGLSVLGHQVSGLCLSYRPKEESIVNDIDESGNTVTWHALNLKRLLPGGSGSYWKKIEQISYDLKPDLIWACSDAIHAIIGANVVRKLGTVLVIDLYDNFESFGLTRFPGMTSVFRNSLRSADGITCISSPLVKYVRISAPYQGPLEVIENAVPQGIFHPMDRKRCRQELRLPINGIFIGTAGAISPSRGIETLFKAFDIIAQEHSQVHLVLAGPKDRGLAIPSGPRVHYLGNLPAVKVPRFLSSLNIAIVCNKESEFGKYCFPQKFYESVACRIPTIVAGTSVMKDLLRDYPDHLYEPENMFSLADALRRQLNVPQVLSLKVPTWNELAYRLSDFFQKCIRKKNIPEKYF